MTSNSYTFTKADKELFAVYQTIYSQSDVEMWYDWNARLNDTKWSDDCFFIYQNGEKIGGVIMSPNFVIYPFLISPFCDRRLYWKLVLSHVKAISSEKEINLRGVSSADVEILLGFGAEIWRPRQIMCRPTDALEYTLDDEFFIETPKESDIPEMSEVLRESFLGGIAYRTFGEDSLDTVNQSIKDCFSLYTATDTWNHSAVVKRKSTNAIVGGCIAGINPEMINRFSFIDDMFVLPAYRGKKLGESLLKHSISAAHKDTTVVKLHVLIGNPAEYLYRKLGFISGPSFIDMKYKVNAY